MLKESTPSIFCIHKRFEKPYFTFLSEIIGLAILWIFWIAGAGGATVSKIEICIYTCKNCLMNCLSYIVPLGKFIILPAIRSLPDFVRAGGVCMAGLAVRYRTTCTHSPIHYCEQINERAPPWTMESKGKYIWTWYVDEGIMVSHGRMVVLSRIWPPNFRFISLLPLIPDASHTNLNTARDQVLRYLLVSPLWLYSGRL